MAISPIEVISLPTKSQEASQMKSLEQQRPANEQMALNEKFRDEIMRHSEQTVAATKADNPEYRYDAKEKGNNPYYAQQKKKKLKKEEKKSNKDATLTNHKSFDIKI
jgi:hypothetical protein